MKRLFFILIATFSLCFSAMAANPENGYVLLNNGTMIKGTVTKDKSGQSVTIVTDNNKVYTYRMTEVNRIVESDPTASMPQGKRTYNTYYEYDRGFWFGFDLYGGISTNVNSSNRGNSGITELDATIGYRVNEFFRFGVGAGFRYYTNSSNIREKSGAWAFPVFLNVRGNLIPGYERKVVPYYSLSSGVTIQDGFMIRPTIGARFGALRRSAFLLGLSYNGQTLKDPLSKTRFQSFVTLNIGYEF